METVNGNSNATKTRPGFLTAWLVFIIFANLLFAIVYLFAGDMITKSIPEGLSAPILILLAIGGIANVIFSVKLFQWKKWGFWGFVITSIGELIIKLSIGLGIGHSLIGLLGVAILYGILKMTWAWDDLE
jgi:hypothetical protein